MSPRVMTIDDFRMALEDVLDQSGVAVAPETTAGDIEGWDSLNHARLLLRIEQRYGIDLPAGEIADAENVGDLLAMVNRILTPAAAAGTGPALGRDIHFPLLRRNDHLAKLTEHFGSFDRGAAEIPDSTSFIFICSTDRGGSNVLADLLASGGQYNRANEFLNWSAVVAIAKRHNLTSFQKVFARLVAQFQKADRFFCRTPVPHLQLLVRSGIMDQIRDRSSFVLMERRDVLAQAIGHAIANSTEASASNQKTTAKLREIPYSREKIDSALDMISSPGGSSVRDHTIFFGRYGIVPAHVFYEQLTADPRNEARRLARELGLENFRVEPHKVVFDRDADAINAEWRKRYLSKGAPENLRPASPASMRAPKPVRPRGKR